MFWAIFPALLCFVLGGILVYLGISLVSKGFFFLCYFFLGMTQETCWNWLQPSCPGVSDAYWVCPWSWSQSTNVAAETHPWERHWSGIERRAIPNIIKYLCAGPCSIYFICITSFNPHNSLMRLVLIWSSFDILENWSTGKVSNTLNVPQIVSGTAKI